MASATASSVVASANTSREAEERFRLLVESVKDYAIFILDADGRVSTWNPGAERIKGYSAAEIVGKHFSTFYPPEVAATGKCDEELVIAAEAGRFEEEGWRLRRDGSKFWANVTITALRDPDGTLVGFAKVTRDLTTRKEAEESLRLLAAERAARTEKERIQEFQERFLAILGHDLRNPLASIDMGAGILRQSLTEPANIRILDRMQSSSRRMTRMIEQILDLTRSRLAGGLEMFLEPMDLRQALTRIVEELRVAFPARSIALDCPSLHGMWDRDRLEQVFSNLIGNALVHGEPNAPVTVQATLDANQVRISVHNRGAPIPLEIVTTLFNPFRRGERESRTSKTAGLGLGLYISQEIVRGHGGRIDVSSTAPDGTTFQVSLPIHATKKP